MENNKYKYAIFSLLLANVLPIFGVVFWGWDLFAIFIIYWIESAVIGFFNILKMFVASILNSNSPISFATNLFGTLFLVAFFTVHYGGFMLGHLIFLFAFFGPKNIEPFSSDFLASVLSILWVIRLAILSLFLSHGVSFFVNFIGRKEYQGRVGPDYMGSAYGRIIVMHLTIILGGMLSMALNLQLAALIFLICLKTGVDLSAHLKEHKIKK